MVRCRWSRATAAVLTAVILLSGRFAAAQVDLSGEWQLRMHEDREWRGGGQQVGEYQGLPINDEARMKAESWNAAVYAMPERQCIPFSADMGYTFGNMRIWKEKDLASQDVDAWRQHHEWQEQERTVWMDSRPHPPEWAPHTWQGFSTGRWEGNTLVVTTTHLKYAYLERNGVPRSDEATLIERYFRHGDFLTVVTEVIDPVYLTEPFVRSRDYQVTLNQELEGYPCRPTVEIDRARHTVPHYLPGTNPHLEAGFEKFGVPRVALPGGAETAYPEFARRLE